MKEESGISSVAVKCVDIGRNTIAIGCTGGQHRSVYVAQTLAEHFARAERVLVRHRALDSRPGGTGITVTQTR